MKTIDEVIQTITAPDEEARRAAEARWSTIAMPLGGLGIFEEMITRIAALRGSPDFRLDRRTLLVFCSDNGVVAEGVTQCGSEVTARVAAALAEDRGTASVLARSSGCRVIPVDAGMLNFPGHPGVRNMRVRNGTGNISVEPAMKKKECLKAMAGGAELVEELALEGTDILAVGEVGIGNTTTATALAAALLGLDPEEVTGRGAGLSTEGLSRKKAAIRRAMERCRAGADDPVGLIAELGGLDIAAMCGAFLSAATYRIPVIVDGVISATAALCAKRLCPEAEAAMLASHVSSEPLGRLLLNELGLSAPLDAGMHLGEGSGALMLMSLLQMVLDVYSSGQSFERLGIEAYQPLD